MHCVAAMRCAACHSLAWANPHTLHSQPCRAQRTEGGRERSGNTMQPVRIGRPEGALARLCRRRESVLLLAGGWAPALQLCFETPALSAEEAQCQRWVTFDSDELSIGLPYGIRYPYSWTVNQLTPRAREFGVDFSVYNPSDKAQTVAVFIKPVPGRASVEDMGSLAEVAKQFATAAPGQKNIGQRKRTLSGATRRDTVYEIETEVGGGTAGRFGSAVELLAILVVDGMEYTVRATSSFLQWRTVRSTLRDALASFAFR